jgi:hypothetical protein
MIISEHQIMGLISLVRNYMVYLTIIPQSTDTKTQFQQASGLVDEITNQQNRELKEIE